jgi:hypothetical protein
LLTRAHSFHPMWSDFARRATISGGSTLSMSLLQWPVYRCTNAQIHRDAEATTPWLVTLMN